MRYDVAKFKHTADSHLNNIVKKVLFDNIIIRLFVFTLYISWYYYLFLFLDTTVVPIL